MIVADTSAWISFIRKDAPALSAKFRALMAQGEVLIGDIILLEVLRGARDGYHARHLEQMLSEFPCVAMMSPQLAIKAAANYRFLRGRGYTIRKSNDLIIGTYCIEHGHKLLQNDRDFQPMADHLGLRLA
ncbi:PIN domain nuclease [Agrobacterium salinitolerans]|uniref:PIN domain nuclease n=1 Tax=Agrobacterium salinitolerans TaxID=1183413 RepID=A0A9X3R336_9HYPH|nr:MULTISPECIES: PIN domain nuclease [Agrobacterium]MCZ7855798.1 PIN domain nuclease [Agrobacterium salinitolerans]MCZ7893388.1 PIN domain nuclease [Agrobacterium salinitolerans]MCZ7940585.1 PIN domain nuclease [Agrobacterium salinitolerans]TRA93846.1 PIN domain nuclease [Agrobacterium salinitolerans]